ncbi:MAG: site-specific integrase [Cognaticolwellia sp.]
MFKFAASHELVKSNPFSAISKVRIESKTKFLSKIEIAKLFDSLKEEKKIYQDVVQILIYTGQRKGNVYSMEWKELDLERGVWTIPHLKTKTKTVYHAQLATPAVEILKRRQAEHKEIFADSPFVFATKHRGSQKGHLSTKSDNSGFWKRIIERAGLYSEDTANRITPHTMRKTLASWQAMAGVDLLSISKSLGHSDISTTARAYAHLSGDTVKAGVQKATDALQEASGQLKRTLTAKELLLEKISKLSEDECTVLLGLLPN